MGKGHTREEQELYMSVMKGKSSQGDHASKRITKEEIEALEHKIDEGSGSTEEKKKKKKKLNKMMKTIIK